MINKCNEWNCTYNENGVCNTDECINDKKDCVNCKYNLDDYWNCKGQANICHEFVVIS